jgi:hypothetical protein
MAPVQSSVRLSVPLKAPRRQPDVSLPLLVQRLGKTNKPTLSVRCHRGFSRHYSALSAGFEPALMASERLALSFYSPWSVASF